MIRSRWGVLIGLVRRRRLWFMACIAVLSGAVIWWGLRNGNKPLTVGVLWRGMASDVQGPILHRLPLQADGLSGRPTDLVMGIFYGLGEASMPMYAAALYEDGTVLYYGVVSVKALLWRSKLLPGSSRDRGLALARAMETLPIVAAPDDQLCRQRVTVAVAVDGRLLWYRREVNDAQPALDQWERDILAVLAVDDWVGPRQ